jgi:hypothetical protein
MLKKVSTQVLCNMLNEATSPYAMRTDEEHAACNLVARDVRRELRSRPGEWKELESGWVVSKASALY